MGPSDMPKEPPKHSDVSPAKTDVNKFLDEWINPSAKPANKSGNTISIGQIDEMKLPSGWQEGPEAKPTGGSSLYREFHPADHPDVKLNFYYRGRRISEQAGKTFHDLLQKPAHILQGAELDGLKEVLRDKSNPESFKTLMAKTEDIAGKRVLVVEGHYPASDLETRSLFIDSDGTGTAVQEVFYQAPRADYSKYLPAANTAIKSIIWK